MEPIIVDEPKKRKKRSSRKSKPDSAEILDQKDQKDHQQDADIEKLEEEIKREVAVRNVKRDLDDLVNKIYNYCLMQSGRSLYPYQEPFGKRIIESVLMNDGEEITALFARQSGKTETVATILAGLMVILPILAKLMPENEELQQYKDGVWIGKYVA